ncbi:glycosyltransferase [Sphingomonas sp. NSE70-1]|uniref:Glycosyltransferase n=1 Tax=Sphingomonas caseinilyticus TaxID=2908205 RepID=A0ABT0RQK7_9SPHN|nr:glycosyltransferase [Sphingomonas caseinilyticus]MCL6697300.1 glycosyltransferase [Sphingomonas caseinilyticus]
MSQRPSAYFIINLVQDINILRPLIVMAARDFGLRTHLLVSPQFAGRDLFGIWERELRLLEEEHGIGRTDFSDAWQASQALIGPGVLFAGSESNLAGHRTSHDILRMSPADIVCVTLQHGFECVGFRHNAAHDRAHGRSVSFAADLVCAWQPLDLLTSMAPSQRAKVIVTGPTSVLQSFPETGATSSAAPGIVCENLHSVRMSSGNLKADFVSSFEQFCGLMKQETRQVVLRPHPGGQYALKNSLPLPANATINNQPMFRVDLGRYAYGISAPSSVIIDMVLAGIPTAVWRDAGQQVSADNYDGLATVTTVSDWADFARSAMEDPEPILERQRRFLAETQMPTDPQRVYGRYAELFAAALRLESRPYRVSVERERILLVANAHLPTVQVCLERPLEGLVRNGAVATQLITEFELAAAHKRGGADGAREWLDDEFKRFGPTALMFSRYSGPMAETILELADGIPVIYHIDDDLLGVPETIGARKFTYHNNPARLETVRLLLERSDLVYTSTERLKRRLQEYYPQANMVAGAINSSCEPLRGARTGKARTVGYMASADHLPNLMEVLPAIVRLLDRHGDLRFELFGSIQIPAELERFGDRIRKVSPIANYEEFLKRFGDEEWDIGICPLVKSEFNLTKSINKWIEYSALGISVIATRGMIYDECCADGAGILADGVDEWFDALDRLVTDDRERARQVERAQQKLLDDYSPRRHRDQILDIISQARAVSRATPGFQPIEGTA